MPMNVETKETKKILNHLTSEETVAKTLKRLQKSKRYLVECLDCESEFESQKLKRDVLGMFIFPKCHLCTILFR